jgi:hypothetical protein
MKGILDPLKHFRIAFEDSNNVRVTLFEHTGGFG